MLYCGGYVNSWEPSDIRASAKMQEKDGDFNAVSRQATHANYITTMFTGQL